MLLQLLLERCRKLLCGIDKNVVVNRVDLKELGKFRVPVYLVSQENFVNL